MGRQKLPIEILKENKKQQSKKFRESEKGILYRKNWYKANYTKTKESKKIYNDLNKEYFRPFKNASVKKYRNKCKIELFNLVGGCFCAWCGCKEIDALELNHLNGSSYLEKKNKSKLSCSYASRLKHLKENPNEIINFNILCRVCNAKHYLKYIKKISGEWNIEFRPKLES